MNLFFFFSYIVVFIVASKWSPGKEYCNHRGIRQPDTEDCVCFQCYDGPQCRKYLGNDCVIDCTVAEGSMFDEWFDDHWETLESWGISIPVWYRPDYPDPMVYPAFDNSFNRRTFNVLTELHKSVNNVNTTSRSLMLGFGSTEVIRGIIYAISKREGKPMWIYAKPPFYPTFRAWANKNPGVSKGLTTRTDLPASDVIEIVTWPNNPDGKYYETVYKNTKWHIYDMVYMWPDTAPILSSRKEVFDFDICVFSSSKLTGHASSRVGWGWLSDAGLAATTIGFSMTEVYAMSVDSLYRQISILEKLPQSSFFDDMKKNFEARWTELDTVLSNQDVVKMHSESGTWFGWLECIKKELFDERKNENCLEFFLRVTGIRGNYGKDETGVTNHVRLNLNLRSETWVLFIERLKLLGKY